MVTFVGNVTMNWWGQVHSTFNNLWTDPVQYSTNLTPKLTKIFSHYDKERPMKVTKVIVKAPRKGKKKHATLHDQKIAPPCTSDQILAALQQQYDVLSFTIENGVATAFVGKLDETE
jgi:hypothetical protein